MNDARKVMATEVETGRPERPCLSTSNVPTREDFESFVAQCLLRASRLKASQPRHRRLLLVHKSVPRLRSLARGLGPVFDVVTTTVPGDALDILRRIRIDILVAEQRGPVTGGGLWLLREALRSHPHVARVLTAERWRGEFEVFRYARVFDTFIAEDVDAEQLIRLLAPEPEQDRETDAVLRAPAWARANRSSGRHSVERGHSSEIRWGLR